MFDQGHLRAGVQFSKVYLIHEGADEEDAAAGAAHEVFGRQRIGQGVGVEAFALIADLDDEGFAVVLKARGDLFGRVVVVAVQDGIHGRLPHRHGQAESLVFVDAGLLGELLGCGLDFAHALHS